MIIGEHKAVRAAAIRLTAARRDGRWADALKLARELKTEQARVLQKRAERLLAEADQLTIGEVMK